MSRFALAVGMVDLARKRIGPKQQLGAGFGARPVGVSRRRSRTLPDAICAAGIPCVNAALVAKRKDAPMATSRKPSYRIRSEDVPTIKKRIRQGDFLNRIAADFDVNPGRISEIKSGKRFGDISPAS